MHCLNKSLTILWKTETDDVILSKARMTALSALVQLRTLKLQGEFCVYQ